MNAAPTARQLKTSSALQGANTDLLADTPEDEAAALRKAKNADRRARKALAARRGQLVTERPARVRRTRYYLRHPKAVRP